MAVTVFATALAGNLVLTYAIIRLSHARGWYDRQDHRKNHDGDVPRIGGIGIFASFCIAIALTLLVDPDAADAVRLRGIAPVLVGAGIIFLTGLVDDFRNIPAKTKFSLQIVAALVVAVGPYRLDTIGLPFGVSVLELDVFSYPLTALWIVAVVNSVNLIDGLDALAGGVSLIASGFAAIIAVVIGEPTLLLVMLALAGSLIGFLAYNRPSAHIFMGDSGAYSVGFVLATIPLLATGMYDGMQPVLPTVLLLAVPFGDTLYAIVRRKRSGLPVHHADRGHLHHQLLDSGLGIYGTLAVIYAISVVSGASALVWVSMPPAYRPVAFAALIVLVVSVVFLIRRRTHSSN